MIEILKQGIVIFVWSGSFFYVISFQFHGFNGLARHVEFNENRDTKLEIYISNIICSTI